MKKLIAVLLVICLAFAGAVGCTVSNERQEPSAEPTAAPSAEPEGDASPAPSAEPTAEPIELKQLDFDAIYATHEPDETVLTVDGRDVTWREYFYWLYTQANQVQSYFSAMAEYYGIASSWEDAVSEDSDESYAQYTLKSVEDMLRQFAAIKRFAEENGVELTEQNKADIAEQLKNDISAACGDDATEEDFEEYLKSIYLSREMYDEMNVVSYLYNQSYIDLYGENGELYDADAALSYLEDNGYISANHILFMTVDPDTGEELDEAAVSEKETTAKQIAKELQAISDTEELLARFAELKEEYCEDTGKTTYPDGYVFTSGTMVAEFEDACNALEEYQVSDPVKSSYGYHVILRLPADADRVMQYSSSGAPMTARAVASNEEFGSRMQSCYETIALTYADGFTAPNLSGYLK